MNKVERHPRRRLAFMAGERRCWQRSKHFYRACHASRQVGRSRECNERCTLERDVRRERMRLECGKSSGAYMTNPLSKKLVTILFKAAKRCSACSHQSSLYATARTTLRTLSQNTPVYIDARLVLPPIFFNPCAATYRVELVDIHLLNGGSGLCRRFAFGCCHGMSPQLITCMGFYAKSAPSKTCQRDLVNWSLQAQISGMATARQAKNLTNPAG